MKRMELRRAIAMAGGCALVLAAPATLADVTLTERLSVQGTGFMSFANMSGTSTTVISGDRARMQSEYRFESRLARMFAGDAGQTAEIVRLDTGMLYQLDVDKRQYSEMSLAQWRDQMQRAMDESREAQDQQPTAMDDSQCEWSDPSTEVSRGPREVIAGYDAEQLTITASQTCTSRDTGQVCEFSLALAQWLAPEFDTDASGFMQAYARELGLDAGAGDFAQRAESFLGRYEGLWSGIAENTAQVDGYPVKSSFSLAVGGPQCSVGSQGDGGGGISAADVGGAVGGIAGRVAGGLMGRRRQQEPEPESVQEPATRPLFTITSELVSASSDPVDPAAFEVPADYRRVSADN